MSRERRIAAIGLVTVVLLACLVLCGFAKAVRAMGHFESLRQHLTDLEAKGQGDLFGNLKREDLNELRGALAEVGADLKGIKAEVGPLLIVARFLGWLPGVGPDVAAAPDLLEIGIGVTTAGELVFQGLDPLLTTLEGSSDPSSEESTGERLTTALVEGRPRFSAAAAELDEVRKRRERIDEELLMPKVVQLLERLDKYFPLLETGVQGLLIAPDLLGAEEPRTYLVIAQNDNELRATGGFISSVALLRIADGRIEELDFRDSYAVDDLSQPHPLAPEPLEEYMLAQIWLIRDANWYPDFPTTAQVARDLYQLDQGVLADGVIAADLVALQSLVAALGPIQLEEYGVEVNAANVMTLMQEYWASPEGEGQTGDWWLHRKDFMGELLGATLLKLETDVGSADLSALIGLLGQGFEEKHILVYLADPTIGGILAENQWDGAVRSTTGDFLMVVDTNMGFNKVNPNIQSSVDYQVVINEDGSLTSQVTVSYQNNSTVTAEQCIQESLYPPTYQEMMEGCYWNYMRVYVPEEAQLLQGTKLALPEGSLRARQSDLGGSPLPPEVGPIEAGKNVLATFFVVPPGEEREIAFRYQMPSDILEKDGSTARYRLLVQKQPGTLSVPLQVTVKLPPDSEAISAEPSATSLTNLAAKLQTNLRVDREFEVVFGLQESSQ